MGTIRTMALGAFLGSALTFTTMGFIACQKPDEKNSAAAGSTGSALPNQDPKELAEVVASVDEVTITVGDLQERINKQSPYIRARYTSLEQKKEFLDNLIRFEVLAKEAGRRGLDKDAEVVRTMKQVMIQKLMKEEFDTRVKPEDVTEDEMKKFYEEHSTEYNKPEEVRVTAIVLKDKATADKVLKEVNSPKGQDTKGFRDLVAQYSIDEASKQRGGDLRYFAQDTTEVPAEVVKAAFGLQKTGDVAGPIEAKGGHYIIKQTGRRKALAKTYDEVKRQIQNRIYRDKRTKAMEDFVKGLRDKAKVTIAEDKLAKVRIDTSAPTTNPGGDMDPHGGMIPGSEMPGSGGHGHAEPTPPGGATTVPPKSATPPPTKTR